MRVYLFCIASGWHITTYGQGVSVVKLLTAWTIMFDCTHHPIGCVVTDALVCMLWIITSSCWVIIVSGRYINDLNILYSSDFSVLWCHYLSSVVFVPRYVLLSSMMSYSVSCWHTVWHEIWHIVELKVDIGRFSNICLMDVLCTIWWGWYKWC